MVDANDDDEVWSDVRHPTTHNPAGTGENGHGETSDRRGGDWVDFDGSDDDELFDGDVGRVERETVHFDDDEDDEGEDVPLAIAIHGSGDGSKSKRNSAGQANDVAGNINALFQQSAGSSEGSGSGDDDERKRAQASVAREVGGLEEHRDQLAG